MGQESSSERMERKSLEYTKSEKFLSCLKPCRVRRNWRRPRNHHYRQQVMDADLRAALFEDADEEGEFEMLDDDFISQAMAEPEGGEEEGFGGTLTSPC